MNAIFTKQNTYYMPTHLDSNLINTEYHHTIKLFNDLNQILVIFSLYCMPYSIIPKELVFSEEDLPISISMIIHSFIATKQGCHMTYYYYHFFSNSAWTRRYMNHYL
jgi:hypothetical protein